MSYFTMITRHGLSKDKIEAYTLISDSYQTITVNTAKLAEMAKAGNVTNITVGEKGIESTNGAMDKYTFVNAKTNEVEGTARAVILDRAEQDGKLLGYTVFMQNGQIRELTVQEATALTAKGLISNGKIRHTSTGDIVSSIGGNYPLRTIHVDKAPAGEITIELMYFAASVSKNGAAKYGGAIISCTSAVTMSKIIDKLTDSNVKTKVAVSKITGSKDTSSLAIKRMGANSLYGVFEIDALKSLVGKAKKAKVAGNELVISILDYATAEPVESVIKVAKGKTEVKEQGTKNGLSAANAYAEEIMADFGKCI